MSNVESYRCESCGSIFVHKKSLFIMKTMQNIGDQVIAGNKKHL
jgi:hypothetical protein